MCTGSDRRAMARSISAWVWRLALILKPCRATATESSQYQSDCGASSNQREAALRYGRPVTDRAVTGATGAYFVAGELSQRGWLASLTRANAPRTDILAQLLDPPVMAAIQVKTRRSGDLQIGIGGERPALPGANEWYVFVALRPAGERADFYVVPRDHVAALVYVGFWLWIADTPLGKSRNPAGTARTCSPEEFWGYREGWHLLEKPASEAPWLLDDWLWDEEPRVGLPDGHPGLGPRPPQVSQ
jgi:hypothetical protein